MLSNNLKTTALAIALGGCSLLALPAAAYDCGELAEALNNKSGLLSFNNYTVGMTAEGSKVRVLPPLPNGNCQIGVMSMRMPNPLKVLSGGDATITRFLEIEMPGPTVVTQSRFSTRFELELPPQTYNAGSQSLLLRQMKFSPAYDDPNQVEGTMSLSIYSNDGGATWFVYGTLDYVYNTNPVTYYYPSAQLLPVAGQSGLRIGVKIDYLSTYSPSNRRWSPKLKVSYDRGGVSAGSLEYSLGANTTLMYQTQGLIAFDNMKMGAIVNSNSVTTCTERSGVGNCPIP